MTSNNKKYQKYSPEWNKEITGLVGKEIDHTFKKGEKKLGIKDEIKTFAFDGAEVTAESGETVKVNDVELLLAERKTLTTDLAEKKRVLKEKGGYTDTYADLALAYDELSELTDEWKTRLKGVGAATYTAPSDAISAGNYVKQWQDFLKTYETNGWETLIKAYNQKPITGFSGNAAKYTNLYDGRLWTGDSATSQDIKITESEAIKWITYTINNLSKVNLDKTEFANQTNTLPSGITSLGVKIDTTTPITAGEVQGWLKTIQDHADCLVEKTDVHTGRKEYDFGHNYWKDDTDASQGMKDPQVFNQASCAAFFELMNFFSQNDAWLSHADVKTKVIKEFSDENIITFLPAQATPFTEGKLHGWGVEGYTEKKFANSDTVTGIYGDIPTSEKKNKAFNFKIEKGLQGWASIMNHFFDVGNRTNVKGKYDKLKDSLTSSPFPTFLNRYQSMDRFGSFTDGATTPSYYTLFDFPKHFYEQQKNLYRLQGLRDAELKRLDNGGEELRTAQQEVDTAKKSVKDKEAEINNKITAAITAKRQELKEKFKVSDTETNDFTGDNKLTCWEHYDFQQLAKDIRFLVNNDEETPTSQVNEDNAYTKSLTLTNQFNSNFLHTLQRFAGVGFQKGESEEERQKRTIAARIAIIQNNENNAHNYDNLNFYHDKLVEMEKLFKLTLEQLEIKTKLKEAIDNQTPEESNQDWRNTLKTIQADLETAFTDEKITEWKKKKAGQAAFDNTASIKTLLEKVMVKKTDGTLEKVNDDFLIFIKGKDAKLEDLNKLIELKEPQEVILLIHQWEYSKLDDTKKSEWHLRYAWSELGGKQQVDEYELTEEDKKVGGNFEKFLYQCAISKINYSSLQKPTEQEEEKKNEDGDKVDSWFKFGKDNILKPTITYLGGTLVIAGVLLAIFWEKFSNWWNGPADEQETVETTKESEEDDEE